MLCHLHVVCGRPHASEYGDHMANEAEHICRECLSAPSLVRNCSQPWCYVLTKSACFLTNPFMPVAAVIASKRTTTKKSVMGDSVVCPPIPTSFPLGTESQVTARRRRPPAMITFPGRSCSSAWPCDSAVARGMSAEALPAAPRPRV